MKKLLTTLIIVLFLAPAVLHLTMNRAEARQGCCSHHGGVCGCKCCDGTPLSSTCAPYYPECSQPEPPVQRTQGVTETISSIEKAVNFVLAKTQEYYNDPHGFREKLVAEVRGLYTDLRINQVGWAVYTFLPDVK